MANNQYDGYLFICKELYAFIPVGSNILYKVKESKEKPIGGTITHNADAKIAVVSPQENNLRSGVAATSSKSPTAITYADIAELWKRYDDRAFVEIHLIANSLAQKKKQIEDLKEAMATILGLVQKLNSANIALEMRCAQLEELARSRK